MNKRYIRKPIGAIADIRRGASPRPIDEWMSSTGIPWVKISDATQIDSRFIWKTEGYIREDGKHKSVEVFPEDLIISNSATPGLPRIMKIHACIHDGWLLAENFNGVTRDYLFYQIKFLRKYLVNQGNGSIFTNLKTDILKEFPIIIPIDERGNIDTAKQNRLATVLTTIDDKIENNNAICAELEAMAKLLYDYWFVQFDFPDENGKPYKSSGGKMVWSEELKREIPEGWEHRSFADCIQSINTGLNPRDNFKLNTGGTIRYLTVKNLTTQGVIDFASCDYIDEDARSIVHRRSDIAVGDILFASIAPLGRCYLISEPPKDWDINESVFSIRPNYQRTTSQFLYMTFMSEAFIKKATNSSTGSVFKGIRINDLLSTMTLLPPIDLLLAFDKRVSELFAMKANCAAENTNLVSLRDFLLPLLMNGQVTFKEADCH